MKKKNKIFNVIMIGLIVMIAASGIMMAGSIKGWFGKNADNTFAKDITGVVNIERSGIAYSINSDTALRDGDILTTCSGSGVKINAGKNSFTLNENTQVTIKAASKEAFSMDVIKGEVFAVIDKASNLKEISFGGKTISADDTVFLLSVQTGSADVDVFNGSVNVTDSVTVQTGEAGQAISCAGSSMAASQLQAASLNDFTIKQAKSVNDKRTLCFTDEDLDNVVNARAQEKQQAEQGKAEHDAKIIAQGGTQSSVSTTSSGSSSSGTGNINENIYTCTIQIRCDTILDNMGDLATGKSGFVPVNGVILATSTVQFADGETVFDILKRTCSYAGIQLEYSWTPMYGSYYVEGINNLYEFDCGSQSGWMYKVNGWFPNYGCSSYKLKDGDTIVWCYTCKGLGADVGGSVY